jgi:hypothetical protein
MWTIDRTKEIASWIKDLDDDAKEAIYKSLLILKEFGPLLGRPYADSVNESKHKNMKELRVTNKKRLYRILFVFDPERTALLLIGGDKRGDKRFYQRMIPLADKLYDQHLEELRKKHENTGNKQK